VQDLTELPENLRAIYRTAWEIPMRSLIDMAADRGAFIDQSQSLNLFVESPNIGKLSSMYMYAWQKGLKTTYYLRSRPATRIAKTTIASGATTAAPTGLAPTQAPAMAAPVAVPVPVAAPAPKFNEAEAIACSLENPEACEACQ
jgi:ribonucleoside-diphosphate reductase alpha chain